MAERIERLDEVSSRYDVILCDVWGVLHNGVDAFPHASVALSSARKAGLSVILITNSPRPGESVRHQLDLIGVTGDAYDAIVSSGDVTRKLIAEGPKSIFFLGPDRDMNLLDGTGARPVEEENAEAIICTGFFDDEVETPETHSALLKRLADRGLPLICANPDLVVERGERLIPCAGAVAAYYETLGGKTRIAGKPHAPIYAAALELAQAKRGPVADDRVLAIGDGMPTDVKGALDRGLDLLYISAGIHARDYMLGGMTDEAALSRFLESHDADPRYWMPRLA
ncbi:TIGR01459 family HAD-type hydrolase [Rhizobium alvei]|uniref:TIGR01459 family HAD-type hydrolase n=1 Tax=Rhizobium alvei TaxID=1132659 RepID=A0ABT8YFP0_9HYPH|nr:TIGR01459 family HAD-type hydrolase [Rhizobium alvei]MDO6962456.1 TIGR01459 family HAD-type hydrolase [Rhizobium alvei]